MKKLTQKKSDKVVRIQKLSIAKANIVGPMRSRFHHLAHFRSQGSYLYPIVRLPYPPVTPYGHRKGIW